MSTGASEQQGSDRAIDEEPTLAIGARETDEEVALQGEEMTEEASGQILDLQTRMEVFLNIEQFWVDFYL